MIEFDRVSVLYEVVLGVSLFIGVVVVINREFILFGVS